MKRSHFTTIGSFFTALLLAGTVLLGGCSDSFTGVTPPEAEENVTLQERAQHNTNDVDTSPQGSHNTSSED